jgi:hypothetical protein
VYKDRQVVYREHKDLMEVRALIPLKEHREYKD